MAAFDDRVLLSRPIRTYMLGMESTTLKMQQAGWEFSSEYRIEYMATRVIARHEAARMIALSDMFEADLMRYAHDAQYIDRIGIHFRYVANRMNIQLQESSFDFNPVDMYPQFIQTKNIDVNDMNIFAKPLVRTNEIIVPEETVDDLMGRILELQEPGRQEYYKRKMREDREGQRLDAQPQQKFHAQIISIA